MLTFFSDLLNLKMKNLKLLFSCCLTWRCVNQPESFINIFLSSELVWFHSQMVGIFSNYQKGREFYFFKLCYSLAAAGNKSTMPPPLPPPGCRGEGKESGRNWWVGIRAV